MYATRDRRLSRGLLLEALAFALCSYVVMWVYRKYVTERMSNYGNTCPNGYEKAVDPANSNQQICVPTGEKTYPPLDIDALKK
jgi:hypothetical protein